MILINKKGNKSQKVKYKIDEKTFEGYPWTHISIDILGYLK